MSWDQIDKAKEGGGVFIKLKAGQSVEGVFRGEPHCFYQIFGDKTEYPDYVPGSSFRFKINMVVKENGAWVSRIFNGGVTVGKQIRKYLKECGTNMMFKIEREGSTKDDTEYYIFPKGQVSPADMANINAVKLQSLQAKNGAAPQREPGDDEDLPPVEAYEGDATNF